MKPEEKSELWEELSVVEDWLSGGFRRERMTPDFSAVEAAAPVAGSPERGDAPALVGASPLKAGESPAEALSRLSAEAAACDKCRLCEKRRAAVFGVGPVSPLVLVVGEGPGAEEDATGLPFVGPAGKLLDKMLASIGLGRDRNCYISNVVKCRPPQNRDPAPDEVAACMPYLEAQIALLSPAFILCLGRSAARALTGSEEGITRLRGRWFAFGGIPLIATYHPSALLRDPSLKRPAWEDLKTLRDRLGDV